MRRQGDRMKHFDRSNHRNTTRTAVIVFAAAACIALSFASTRRAGLALLAATVVGATVATSATAKEKDSAIRPFRVNVPAGDIAELRRRLAATRWPDHETVADHSQGVRVATLRDLVDYWGKDYDWRKAEARLNAYPQFITTIDGVDVHFMHVRSPHPNALPVVIAHGWPGSVFEQVKLIEPLTDPMKYGGRADDAFDVVIPSLPGYGFSAAPTEAGWGSDRIALALDVLMKRLGYASYVAQGGDWGASIVQAMGRHAPAGLMGIHTNFPATVPNEVGAALGGGPLPAGLSDQERAVVDALRSYGQKGGLAYVQMLGARPQAVGYGMTDSPVGLAAFMLVHPGFAEWSYGQDPEQTPTRDEVLDNFTLYWLTNSATSAARIYWENREQSLISAGSLQTDKISVPVAISIFPDEVYRAPETWARRAYPNVIYFHQAAAGGHFAAWEYPQLFAEELRAGFRSLRSTR